MTDPAKGAPASEQGFRVIDRRGTKDESSAHEPPRPEAASSSSDTPPPSKPERDLPALDFSTFILSLSTSALYHMGLVADPETGQTAPPNLPLARQTIDTLELLQRKTHGNLEPEETRLLESLLYELRMRFVEARR